MCEIWIVEYSAEQDCFHVDTLDRIISGNRRAMNGGKMPSYIPIGATISLEAASDMAATYRAAMDRRRELTA